MLMAHSGLRLMLMAHSTTHVDLINWSTKRGDPTALPCRRSSLPPAGAVSDRDFIDTAPHGKNGIIGWLDTVGQPSRVVHHDRIPDLFDGRCSDDLQLPNTYTRAIAGPRRVWVIQRIALPGELQDEVEDDRTLAQTSLKFFKEIIRRLRLQFFQRLTSNAGLRFPVIASVLRLVRLVHESKRVKHVKSSLSKACRRRQGFRELNRVCDPWTSC